MTKRVDFTIGPIRFRWDIRRLAMYYPAGHTFHTTIAEWRLRGMRWQWWIKTNSDLARIYLIPQQQKAGHAVTEKAAQASIKAALGSLIDVSVAQLVEDQWADARNQNEAAK